MILLLIILTIILDATGDGLMLKYKVWSHAVQSLCVLIWLIIFYLATHLDIIFRFPDFLCIVASYALMRFGLFDFAYNLVAGQPFGYVGSTSIFDRYIGKTFLGIWPARLFYLVSGFIFFYKLIY
jgi:hypothetical protein